MSNKINVGNPEVTTKTNILDIGLPTELENAVSTGWDHFDALCAGDGMVPSTVMILTGLPGSGKTTCALQLADSITRTGNIALYNTCEESIYQVRRTAKRMDLKHGFIPSYFNEASEIIDHAETIRAENPGKQVFLFVDSLQTVECNEIDPKTKKIYSQQAQVTQATWRLAEWAKKNYTNVIIIGQVTKDGTFAGKQEVKHATDMHISLHLDTERRSETYGERVAMVEKNRFGVGGLYFSYEITARGLQFKD
jgi:predicted ATP-dependent serine protease